MDGYSSKDEEVEILSNGDDEISTTFVLGRTSRFVRAIRYTGLQKLGITGIAGTGKQPTPKGRYA